MVTLKVTAKGQVTLKREVLEHLGIVPGDEIEIDLLPKGEGRIHMAAQKVPIDSLFGMFAYKVDRAYSIEEINEAIAAGWADEVGP